MGLWRYSTPVRAMFSDLILGEMGMRDTNSLSRSAVHSLDVLGDKR